MTPTERQRKVKPKGKAVFNLNFQLFSESGWEGGDMFCSLDCHKNPEAAEVLNARAERSIIHIYLQEGKGCWLHCNTAPVLIIPCVNMGKLASRSALTVAEAKEVVKNADSVQGVGCNAQSLTQAARTCQVTLCNTADALCPDFGLK